MLNKKIYMLKESTLRNEDLNNFSDNGKDTCISNVDSEVYQIKSEQEQRTSTAGISTRNTNRQQSSISIYKKIQSNKKLILFNKMRKYAQYTDNELNNLPFYEAILLDKRSFIQIYFSLIKTRQILFFALGCKNDFNPRTMKISFMFSIFAIFLTINTLFVTDSTLHDLFISNGKMLIYSDIKKMGFSILISSIIKNILLSVIFPEKDILKIRKYGIQKILKKNPVLQKSLTMVIIKCYIFFFISFIIIIMIWIYLTCFFIIFLNTQMYVIKRTLISFGISLAAPFILYIIPTIVRKLAVKGDGVHGNFCLYATTKIILIIIV